LAHHKQVLKLRILPNTEVFTPNVKLMKVSIFGQPYRFQEDNNGQSIWDEGRCYWEYVEEDVGNPLFS
jgi:hypothetical protein